MCSNLRLNGPKESRSRSSNNLLLLSAALTPGTKLDKYASSIGVKIVSTSGRGNLGHMIFLWKADSGLCKSPKNEEGCSLACQRVADLSL